MTTAKITRCKHYFHGVCLRKWLYVQDKCPLCHTVIMNQDDDSTPINTTTTAEGVVAAAAREVGVPAGGSGDSTPMAAAMAEAVDNAN